MGRKAEFTETEYAAAFWRKVRTVGHPRGCWEWTAATANFGYGVTCRKKRMRRAHREALAFFGVSIPPGMFVLHDCDNPPCVNPAHLTIGTAKENTQDSKRKRRNNYGERNGMATLTTEDVRAIRSRVANGERQVDLALAFGVGAKHIGRIVHGYRWGSVR